MDRKGLFTLLGIVVVVVSLVFAASWGLAHWVMRTDFMKSTLRQFSAELQSSLPADNTGRVAVMESLGPAATESDYLRAALQLDDQVGQPGVAGIHPLDPNGEVPRVVVARLNVIEKANPIRNYKTMTGAELKPFMTDGGWQRWQANNNTDEMRKWYKSIGLQDSLRSIKVNTLIFTPDMREVRADYVRVMRLDQASSYALGLYRWKIGEPRTETHVYWLVLGDDGVWRIKYANDPAL